MATALLLVNLGTPRSTSVADVRSYLREFLSDPDVISLPAPLRFLLLEGVILRTRPKKSAAAYATIWTERGSPLAFHSADLLAAVKPKLKDVEVGLAMRYGDPSIASQLAHFQEMGITRIVVFPLYPQYARASTKTVVDKVNLELKKLAYAPAVSVVDAFFDDDAFIGAFLDNARAVLDAGFKPDGVLFSYHGYPERYLREDSGGHCLSSSSCCDTVTPQNRDCYLRQCKRTSDKLIAGLGLTRADVIDCYQSRLRDNWIRPFTDAIVIEAAKAGKKRLLVMCPAFVADCLETLEEIQGRAAEDFRAHGGEELRLVPSLNAQPAWVDAVVALARPHLA
jgi:ferrochelatase